MPSGQIKTYKNENKAKQNGNSQKAISPKIGNKNMKKFQSNIIVFSEEQPGAIKKYKCNKILYLRS